MQLKENNRKIVKLLGDLAILVHLSETHLAERPIALPTASQSVLLCSVCAFTKSANFFNSATVYLERNVNSLTVNKKQMFEASCSKEPLNYMIVEVKFHSKLDTVSSLLHSLGNVKYI